MKMRESQTVREKCAVGSQAQAQGSNLKELPILALKQNQITLHGADFM